MGELKTIEKIELVEKKVTKYVAEDGTEFANWNECNAYEEKCNLEKLSQIEHCADANGSPNFDGIEHMEYSKHFLYRPKNEQEIDLLQKIYLAREFGIDNADIGKWICVEVCNDSTWYSRLDEGIKYARELLEKLGYKMTVTKK